MAQPADDAQRQRESNTREAVRRAFPLTEQDLQELFRTYDKQRRSESRHDDPASYVAPERRQLTASFARGGQDHVVRTATNYPTVISFFDNTGSPWPVSVKRSTNPVGDKTLFGGFEVEIPVDGGNSVEITPRQPYARGGLVIYLKDAPAPITLMLQQGLPAFDSNLRIQVAARGPNAPAHVVMAPDALVTGAGHMTDMLAGITPAGAKPLRVSGASPDAVRGWRMGDNLYVVSQARPHTPRPMAFQNAEAGWQVFAVPMTRRGATTIIMTDGTQNFPVTFQE